MAVSKEEMISDLFVQVEIKLDSLIQMCENAEKAYESAEWNKEKRLTLLKFDELVKTAEGNNEAAKDCVMSHLRACLLRVRFAHKLAEIGLFVLFDGPGKLFPIPGVILRLLKSRDVYEKF
uniref:PhoU domain-containing protein n=1 Tax=Caenorhabditis tropicalis TaxID=1561998 RepID=A0A1I7URU4_9PELO